MSSLRGRGRAGRGSNRGRGRVPHNDLALEVEEEDNSNSNSDSDAKQVEDVEDESTDPPRSVIPVKTPMLFGQTVSTFSPLPRFHSSDQFTLFKDEFMNYAVMNNFHYLIEKNIDKSWPDALDRNYAQLPISMLKTIFLDVNRRVVAAIKNAVIKVIPNMNVVIESIRADHVNDVIVPSLPTIPSESNAYLVWTKVCTMYEQKTMYSVLNVWKKLLAIQYKEGEDPTKFFNEFHTLNQRLILSLKDDRPMAGQVLSEQCKAVILLNALPKTLQTDQSILMARERVSLDEIRNMLVRKYESKGNAKSVTTDPAEETAHANFQSNGYKKTGF
jgi:hypothetical protein